jgi:polysaccharide deacetylase family protein (PEP-CTERM system associated)
VEANTKTILDLFDDCKVTGTFFVLGWVADRFPALVREIARRGHELACHSYWHRKIYKLSPDQFREDTGRAKQSIEQASSTSIEGYRAPSFSVIRESWWALEILAELGFRYDSSVFPIRHDNYGIPSAPRAPFRVDTAAGSIVEFPMTTFRWLGHGNLPVGGGGYLRIFPEFVTRIGVRKASQDGLPLIAYTHPWEIDPDQPRMAGRLTSRLRHYTNLSKTDVRLRHLIAAVDFSSFRASGLIESTLCGQPESLFRIPA